MQTGKQAGFVYIGLLIGLAVVGVGLGAISEVWHQSQQREREEELLFIGGQFRQAITRYYLESPSAQRRFPMQITDLLEDLRAPAGTRHHLRKIYLDPMTGKADWGEIRLASGQLVGVYSLSALTPIKSANFELKNKGFSEALRYSDWTFRSELPAANPVLADNGAYSAPGAPVGLPGSPQGTAPVARPAAPTPPGYLLPLPRTR
jgi:type II secretory pathway pseudopilin PulG